MAQEYRIVGEVGSVHTTVYTEWITPEDPDHIHDEANGALAAFEKVRGWENAKIETRDDDGT